MPTAVEYFRQLHSDYGVKTQDNLGLENKLLNFALNFDLEGREGHLGELLSQKVLDALPAVQHFGELEDTLEILGIQHDFTQDHWPG